MDDHSRNSELLSDLLGMVVGPPSIRVTRGFQSLSGRITPRTSPTSARRTQLSPSPPPLHSHPHPSKASPVKRRQGIDACHPAPEWLSQFQARAILPWLILFLGLWSYIGIQLHPRWAYVEEADADSIWSDLNPVKDVVDFMKDIVENEDMGIVAFPLKASLLAENQGTVRDDGYSIVPPKKKSGDAFERKTENWRFPFIGLVNHSVGRLVGPFKDAEEKIFGLTRWKRYLAFSKRHSKPIAWWIMENRHEYFDKSKHVLGKVNVLIFLSEAQLQQWQAWSEMEGISLPSKIEVIPLSVNEELSMKAGLEGEDSEAVEDRQRVLRDSIRKEMGLTPSDMLIASLSTISRAKGQLLLLRAVLLALKNGDGDRKCLDAQRLKIIIGSVGSRSNKVIYTQDLLNLISSSSGLSNATFWTPATVNVAPLYLAADAYVMNSQGIGETFGRVTIEAMAFGLPVLGTEAGGTKEIIEDNVTGLLHPVGKEGVTILARQIRYILCNSRAREQMGLKGRERVKNFYMKRTMYEKIARALRV